MNTRTILQKLKSTKLWMAIAGVATGIALSLGADANDIQVVSGAVTALVSLVSYIITEGKIDAASVEKTVALIEEASEVLDES